MGKSIFKALGEIFRAHRSESNIFTYLLLWEFKIVIGLLFLLVILGLGKHYIYEWGDGEMFYYIFFIYLIPNVFLFITESILSSLQTPKTKTIGIFTILDKLLCFIGNTILIFVTLLGFKVLLPSHPEYAGMELVGYAFIYLPMIFLVGIFAIASLTQIHKYRKEVNQGLDNKQEITTNN